MADDGFSPYVDDKGNISFPEGFRTSMEETNYEQQ